MLTRRSLLSGAASTFMSRNLLRAKPIKSQNPQRPTKQMIYPPRLRTNDLVAIVAPAGCVPSQENLQRAKSNLESQGLRVKVMPNAGNQWGYLAGTDMERASDFNEAIRDPEIKGIIALRGGYGSMRILPALHYDLFQKNPKVVMGYSDITAILNALTRRTGVITFHGPIAEATFEGFEGEQMRRALFEKENLDTFPEPSVLRGSPVFPSARTIVSGNATGRLIGGNLSLIEPCANTQYGPEFKEAILFIEDIAEAPYRVDRMLTSLWLRGCLSELKGIVIGDFRLPKPDSTPDDRPDFSMEEVFDHLSSWIQVPIFSGLYAGHIPDKLTLPIGAEVEIDADAKTLRFISA